MSTQPKSRRGRYHHGDLAGALVDEATALLDAHGADAVTMREVARRAGVTHAAPYRHFRNKDALLATVADEGWRELARLLSEARPADDPAARAVALGVAYLGFARAHPARYALMLGQARSGGGRGLGGLPPTSRSGHARFERLLANALRAAHAEPPRTAEARLLWALWHGLALLPASAQDEAALVAAGTEALLAGLGRTGRGGGR